MKVIFRSLLLAAVVALTAQANIIGTNHPAAGLTEARIGALPADQQPAWRAYLERSVKQKQADQKALHDEMRAEGLKESRPAPHAKNFSGLPLNRKAEWYGTEEARRLANIVVSFQTPAGGWSKRLELTKFSRAPGMQYAPDNTSRFLSNTDNDMPANGRWSYVGTLDNDATTTQLRFLARVITAAGTNHNQKFNDAFTRGLEYVFNSQMPNGGWPQVWPLDGGYHDAITYNDGAMTHALELLRDVAAGKGDFAFTEPALRARAAAGFQRGIDCLLKTQIVQDGKRTVWCQQHDALTLAPCAARNYEMPSASGAESVGLLLFLMRLPSPDSNVVAAVEAAAAWLAKVKLPPDTLAKLGRDTRYAADPKGDGSLWARYYELGTDKPIFGDRDLSIHDDVSEISAERRKGYAWFNDGPKKALEEYAKWKAGR